MGAGLAKQASELVTDLPGGYGQDCRSGLPWKYYPEWHMICVPTKPLNTVCPHLSWQGLADVGTIQGSLRWLEENAQCFPNVVYVPLLGAGNGGLAPELVQTYMEATLKAECFVGVVWNP